MKRRLKIKTPGKTLSAKQILRSNHQDWNTFASKLFKFSPRNYTVPTENDAERFIVKAISFIRETIHRKQRGISALFAEGSSIRIPVSDQSNIYFF